MGNEELARSFERKKESVLFLESIRREYTEKFPHKWIVVDSRKVFGPTDTPEELRALIDREGLGGSVQVAYLDEAYFLPAIL